MDEHIRIIKLASILLQYPERDWLLDPDLKWEISNLEDQTVQKLYLQFVTYMESKELMELGEEYVQTFDFSDKTTLYVTYGMFGDNQERGAALLKLKEEFANAGFPLDEDELPDFLPLILEFVSFAPADSAKQMLMINKRAIDRLASELEASKNPYGLVMRGCVQAIETFLTERKAS